VTSPIGDSLDAGSNVLGDEIISVLSPSPVYSSAAIRTEPSAMLFCRATFEVGNPLDPD
jgi:hypothetical protein